MDPRRLLSLCVDEVALEGGAGITEDALWARVQARVAFEEAASFAVSQLSPTLLV